MKVLIRCKIVFIPNEDLRGQNIVQLPSTLLHEMLNIATAIVIIFSYFMLVFMPHVTTSTTL